MLKHCGNAIISAGIVATDNSTAGDQKNVAATTSMPGSRNGPGCEPFPGLWPQLALKPALLNASEALHATPRDVSLKPMDQLAEAIPVMVRITRPDDADGQPLPVPRSGQPFRPRSSNHTYSPSLSSGQKRGDCPRCSTSKITNHHSTITNQNQPHLIFLLSTLCHLLSGASGSPPSGLWGLGGVPRSGGLRTPAEICRPPG